MDGSTQAAGTPRRWIRLGAEARVWHTELDGQDFMTVRCLSPHATEDRSQWLAQQRIFWRQILDDLGSQGSVQPNAHSTASAEQSSTVQPQQAPLAAAAQSPAYSPQFTQRIFTTLDQAVQLSEDTTGSILRQEQQPTAPSGSAAMPTQSFTFTGHFGITSKH